jgi:hypothetical protein
MFIKSEAPPSRTEGLPYLKSRPRDGGLVQQATLIPDERSIIRRFSAL